MGDGANKVFIDVISWMDNLSILKRDTIIVEYDTNIIYMLLTFQGTTVRIAI